MPSSRGKLLQELFLGVSSCSWRFALFPSSASIEYCMMKLPRVGDAIAGESVDEKRCRRYCGTALTPAPDRRAGSV